MEAIVTCIKHSTSNTYWCVAKGRDGAEGKAFKSRLALKVGEAVAPEMENGTVLESSDADELYSDILGCVKKTIEKNLAKEPYFIGVGDIDSATVKAWSAMLSSARLFVRKLILGIPIIIRFHNDADGSSGAIGIQRGIQDLSQRVKTDPNTVWIMHKGVTYSPGDAESDTLIANNCEAIEKPLLLLIDFGTSVDSNKGISLVKEKFDIIWLEHHPLEQGFEGVRLEHYINPWNLGSDSNYTAGLLACVFSHTFSHADTSELESASMIGDYSKFAHVGNKTGDEASTILDLVTSAPRIIAKSGSNLSPSEIDAVLHDKEKRKELYSYAKIRLDELLEMAVRSVKKVSCGDADLFILDYEDSRNDESKYPLPGRFSSRLFSRLESEKGPPLVLVVHFGAFISMRVSTRIGEKANITMVISRIKEMYPDLIESGGGHRNAASIKLISKEDKKAVLRSVTDEIRANLSG